MTTVLKTEFLFITEDISVFWMTLMCKFRLLTMTMIIYHLYIYIFLIYVIKQIYIHNMNINMFFTYRRINVYF